MKLRVEDIARVTGGKVLQQSATEFDSYEIDSRKVKHGGLFFALKGTETDGHLYILDAAKRGADGAVIERIVDGASITLIQTNDSLVALHDLAASVRAESKARFVGITGSSGKTSTKEFTAALLAEKYGVYKSEGNLNSTTGLPLSLLAFQEEECAVFEIGMNHPGEIASLTTLLEPHIGVVLNVNPVHLGYFKSVEAIADEKCDLIRTMPAESIAIYNADDNLLRTRVEGMKRKTFSFGVSKHSDLSINDVHMNGVRGTKAAFHWKGERVEIETGLCGTGHLMNIAAATSVALQLNLSWDQIRKGITKLQPYQQRGQLIEFSDIHIYDDSYNSNPRALAVALETVAQSTGYSRKIAVLGDMLELGPDESRFHFEAGELAAKLGFDVLVTAGPLSAHMAEGARRAGLKHVIETKDSIVAADHVSEIVRKGDLLLVKGSRGMKMERVIDVLKERTA